MGDTATTTTAKIGKRERRRTGRAAPSSSENFFARSESISDLSFPSVHLPLCAESEPRMRVLCSCSATLICIPPSAPPQ